MHRGTADQPSTTVEWHKGELPADDLATQRIVARALAWFLGRPVAELDEDDGQAELELGPATAVLEYGTSAGGNPGELPPASAVGDAPSEDQPSDGTTD